MTLTVTASVRYGARPSVVLQVSSSPSVNAVLSLYRVHSADGSVNPVLTSGRAVLNGTWIGIDYHPPFNQQFSYIASTGLEPDSAPSTSRLIPREQTWLQHPRDPELSVLVESITKVGAKKLPTSTQLFKVLGSPYPVSRSNSPRGPKSWDLEILVADPEAAQRVEDLFADDLPVLINSTRTDAFRWVWIQAGDLTIRPPEDKYRTDYRLISFSCTECAPPDVDVVPTWVMSDLDTEFAASTLDSLSTKWSTLDDITIDRRL